MIFNLLEKNDVISLMIRIIFSFDYCINSCKAHMIEKSSLYLDAHIDPMLRIKHV